jgi:hypothetical protein
MRLPPGIALPLLLIAPAARASDGVIEINQARAEAGGVTATDTPGFPVTLGVPGSYRLTSNLDVTRAPVPENTTAILVEAPDVAIDLNGFAILGPTACGGAPFACAPIGQGFGIRGDAAERTVVRDGIVRGLGGIGIWLGDRSTIVGTTVSNCGGGGVQAIDSRISGNVIALNRVFGINGGGVIENNQVSSNDTYGIRAFTGGTVVNNVAERNLGVGISVLSPAVVIGNLVRANSGLGLELEPSTGFAQNVVTANGGSGNPPQTSSGIQTGTNVCGNDTICP